MKRLFIIFLLLICAFAFLSFSPAPTHTYFGGNIFFINASSCGLYWEFDIIDKSKGGFKNDRLCIEKNDTVMRQHLYSVLIAEAGKFNRSSADPNNYFNKITIYDMETGALLIELLPEDMIFILKSGSIEKNDAVYEVFADDSFLSGGQ